MASSDRIARAAARTEGRAAVGRRPATVGSTCGRLGSASASATKFELAGGVRRVSEDPEHLGAGNRVGHARRRDTGPRHRPFPGPHPPAQPARGEARGRGTKRCADERVAYLDADRSCSWPDAGGSTELLVRQAPRDREIAFVAAVVVGLLLDLVPRGAVQSLDREQLMNRITSVCPDEVLDEVPDLVRVRAGPAGRTFTASDYRDGKPGDLRQCCCRDLAVIPAQVLLGRPGTRRSCDDRSGNVAAGCRGPRSGILATL